MSSDRPRDAGLSVWWYAAGLLLMAAACGGDDDQSDCKPVEANGATRSAIPADTTDPLDNGGTGGFGGLHGIGGRGGAGGMSLDGRTSGMGSESSKGGTGRGGAGGNAATSAAAGSRGASASASAAGGRADNALSAVEYIAKPFEESNECAACQQRWPVCATRRNACLEAKNTAAAGPKAGAQKSDLCRDTLACLHSSRCADVMADPLACLCGLGVTLDPCVTSGAKGACLGELEASAETVVALEISTRLGDPSYASGLAFRTLLCAERYCPKACGLCESSNPLCTDMQNGAGSAP